MSQATCFNIFTDGGARGNPGPAAVGVVIKNDQNEIVHRFGKYIGKTTNNVAEYTGVIAALEWLISTKPSALSSMHFYLDSLLVVNQLNGLYKVKDAKLRELLLIIRRLENEIGARVSYRHIPRERNREADALVNQALDSLTDKSFEKE